MTVLISKETDPAINLALEAYLRAETDENYLLFYINGPSVIIGRNQRAEAEADLGFCRDNGIAVIRRISGGGAVYHDHGNINYSFITTGITFPDDRRRELAKINAILMKAGIDAIAGSRGEIFFKGFKISGTASFCRGGRCIFHGTLLYDSDLVTLERSLMGEPALRGKKIASVPSPVTNISQYTATGETTAAFMERFARSAASILGGRMADAGTILRKHSSRIKAAYSPEIILGPTS